MSIPDLEVREEIAYALLDLVENPLRGDHLAYLASVGDLSDCRKLYVDVDPSRRPPGPPRYRIVYRLLPDERSPASIEIVCIGPRADELAYRRALVRLERPFGKRVR